MQDATILIFKMLNDNPSLIQNMGGKDPSKGWNRIYNSPDSDDINELPRINIFEVANSDDGAADDEPLFSDVNVRIELRTDTISNLFSIAKEIKKTIKSSFSCSRVELGETITDVTMTPRIYLKPINVFLLLTQGE